MDGTAFLGGGEWIAPLAGRLKRALAAGGQGPISPARGVRLYPLAPDGRLAGGLVVREPSADAMVATLLRGIVIILRQALETRSLGAETLDRYREINLLYHLGETVGASLDSAEIPRLVLAEAIRAIEADAAAVLIGPDPDPALGASLGRPAIVERMVRATRTLVEQVMEAGQPRSMALPASDASQPRAVLCVPIRAQDSRIGAVLLGRREGREAFSAGDEKLLTAIASEGGVAYDRALLHEQKLQRERLDEELAVGRRIQLSLLPASSPRIPGWEFAAVYRAARQVGGDFYDFIETPEAPGTISLVIGDVTGKGVPAALLMASTRAVLRASSSGAPAPSVVLERTNEHLLRDRRAGLFVTALYATLNAADGQLVFASGGHDPPLWVRAGGRSHLLTTRSMILGAFSEIALEDRRVVLGPGDVFVLYTDGITEARDRRGRLFGERRLRAAVTPSAGGTAEGTAQAILGAVNAFAGDVPLPDDLTLVVVKRRGPA